LLFSLRGGGAMGPIEPEIYHYNFTVDGLRIINQFPAVFS
jgi:hypothetical protein